MASKHTHSIHIDAPVEKVFHYVEDPEHFVAQMANEATVAAVERTPDGLVTSYQTKYRQLGMHLTADITREEQVVNKRIVDHSSLGVVFTYSFEPDDTGTTLTLAWDASTLMKVLDAAFFHSDKDVEAGLAAWKREIEALP